MSTHWKKQKWILALSSAILAVTGMGCGKQAYVVGNSSEASQAPGTYLIPPKVDILLAEDDTGSMKEAYSQIATQLPNLLSNLDAQRWDYHFAVTPLTTRRPINQVAASRFDGNWGDLWTRPFPDAPQFGPGTVTPYFFRKPFEFSEFLTPSDPTSALGGMEPGLDTIRYQLTSGIQGSGFLRTDALLVVLVAGNGNDTSGITYCTRSDGLVLPCEQVTGTGTQQSSFDSYKNSLLSVKAGDSARLRFYAAVSTANRSSCLGGAAYAGTRYINMASALRGQTYDICTTPIASIIGSLSNLLQSERASYRTRFLLITQQPDPSTITVTKYLGGNGNQAVTIPQDANNGWTYVGYSSGGVNAIDYPLPSNPLPPGYLIELHGDAKLMGQDTAKVDYKIAGASNSVAK